MAGLLEVYRENGLVVPIVLVAVVVPHLRPVPGEREPKAIARLRIVDEPTQRLQNMATRGCPGAQALALAQAGGVVSEDVEVGVRETEARFEEMVDKGDVADAAFQLRFSAGVVDADDYGLFAPRRCEGGHGLSSEG